MQRSSSIIASASWSAARSPQPTKTLRVGGHATRRLDSLMSSLPIDQQHQHRQQQMDVLIGLLLNSTAACNEQSAVGLLDCRRRPLTHHRPAAADKPAGSHTVCTRALIKTRTFRLVRRLLRPLASRAATRRRPCKLSVEAGRCEQNLRSRNLSAREQPDERRKLR